MSNKYKVDLENVKLSETQKKVISLMRDGWELIKSRFIGYSAVTLNCKVKQCQSIFINKNTFNSLSGRGIIEFKESKGSGRMSSIFELTELGKTIKL